MSCQVQNSFVAGQISQISTFSEHGHVANQQRQRTKQVFTELFALGQFSTDMQGLTMVCHQLHHLVWTVNYDVKIVQILLQNLYKANEKAYP